MVQRQSSKGPEGVVIPVSEWLPDQVNDEDGSPDEDIAKNVIPDIDSYRPWPQQQTLTQSLSARCQGAYGAIDTSRIAYDFAGTAKNLWRNTSVTAWENYSRTTSSTYTISNDQWWEFVQWGNTVLATNGIDEVQEHSLGTTTHFANLAGVPPRGYHLAIVRDFVWLGNISGSPQRVQWSAINNSHSWTVDAATQADFQDLPGEGGDVQRVVGGNVATVLQERAIWRAHYVGSPTIFDFGNGPIVRGLGTSAPQSVAWYEDMIFFLAESGFCMLNSQGIQRIGQNRIDRSFFNDLDAQYLYRIQATIDPVDKLYLVAYPGSGNSSGRPNRILVYNYGVNRWSRVEQEAEMIWRYYSVGYTLDGLDPFGTLDALPESLDSGFWAGGQVNLACFNSTHQAALFTGDSEAAKVSTREVELIPGRRTRILRSLIEGDALGTGATVTVWSRNQTSQPRIQGNTYSQESTGDVTMRTNNRYHLFNINAPAGTNFTRIRGIKIVEASDAGSR